MTLCVARNTGKELVLLADTRITEHDRPKPLNEGLLKSVILSSECCLSFAGSPELASRSVEEFRAFYPKGANFFETRRYFEEKHICTNVDFLLAFAHRKKFVRISDGHAQDVHEGWIGDAAAFKRYKEYEQRTRPSPHGNLWTMDITPFSVRKKNIITKMMIAFDDIIYDSDIESVGGFYTIVTNSSSVFKFEMTARLYFDRLSEISLMANRSDLHISYENSSYEMSILAPESAGVTAAAYYFNRAKLGFVFYSETRGVANKCRVFRNLTDDEFRDACVKQIGINFHIIMLSHDPQIG